MKLKNMAVFNWFAEPVSKVTGKTIARDLAFSQIQSILLSALEEFASFVDRHDIVVPELRARYGGLEFTLTGRKVEDLDASPAARPDGPKDPG